MLLKVQFEQRQEAWVNIERPTRMVKCLDLRYSKSATFCNMLYLCLVIYKLDATLACPYPHCNRICLLLSRNNIHLQFNGTLELRSVLHSRCILFLPVLFFFFDESLLTTISLISNIFNHFGAFSHVRIVDNRLCQSNASFLFSVYVLLRNSAISLCLNATSGATARLFLLFFFVFINGLRPLYSETYILSVLIDGPGT